MTRALLNISANSDVCYAEDVHESAASFNNHPRMSCSFDCLLDYRIGPSDNSSSLPSFLLLSVRVAASLNRPKPWTLAAQLPGPPLWPGASGTATGPHLATPSCCCHCHPHCRCRCHCRCHCYCHCHRHCHCRYPLLLPPKHNTPSSSYLHVPKHAHLLPAFEPAVHPLAQPSSLLPPQLPPVPV